MQLPSLPSGNKLIYVLIGLGVLVVVLIFIVIIGGIGKQPAKVTLQLWGVFDERSAYSKAISDFKKQYPNINVTYTRQTAEDYEQKSLNAFAAGSGPDIWMIHNVWLPKHQDKLRPQPKSLKGYKLKPITTIQFKEQFVDAAFKDLVSGGQIYALPLYVDTLALYYNKNLFNSVGITRPPKIWKEVNADVEAVTRLDANGNIIQSAAALGTASNINRSTDILAALMLQSGVQMTNSDNTGAAFAKAVGQQNVGQIALEYYTDFTNPSKRTYTWNSGMHYSVDAFIEGSTAMMFNYSHQIPVIRQKAQRFDFGVAAFPQLDLTDQTNYASYWAPAVPLASKHPNEAWLFINFLASKDPATNYLVATNRPAARRDLIEAQKTDDELGIFALQALSAKSWYQVDSSAVEKIFADMINDVNFKRRSVRDALVNAESRVNVLMQKARKK
ncbi:MAG: hypothetical protein A2750_00995 [Candidatus Yanofskybacteria bacterium RIFCSPHIGHO2_01_FULL_45_42]|uniref:ABC transporter substrate-binding protein n=3 Tax=Candidatus Yanofskyibacteriota TaxID=1752733 RepID=A0A1F8H4T6_9BACT|nr:MAG: hypothetical protein A2750_00995 [Candidatus Yanofskybacteria bacterium RIFCSPHIGHO2_01_FULL_45_42]OGN15490.1 MAG: hypothetical protein A3C81_01185 [Candidatus Yanofskybacteria bacterium RIFCSPHIGHO2_02_FULL_46_19]OGN27197.1 MAG: hypothetical protein A3B17_01095 [Candidatus Yanofskybacteria bacterium RIFCSPLOWO2_01_FULL_45_72]OGN31859.1 MAG: hypothetical protein A3J01_01730 [Candidatus Yanofskybacteria bacterium RIFCSPLOWO2_02_FULL_45_18]